MQIAAFAGSLREESFNRKLLRTIVVRYQAEFDLDIIDLREIPFFNEDLEDSLPPQVDDLITRVDKAKALLLAGPEYNNTFSGVIKNTIEWLSRGYSKHAIAGKTIGIMGASTGNFGTVRAQNHLLLLLSIIGLRPDPELRYPLINAESKFDKNGNLTNEEDLARLDRFINKFKQTVI